MSKVLLPEHSFLLAGGSPASGDRGCAWGKKECGRTKGNKYYTLLSLLLAVILLNSCGHDSNKTPVVGDLDSTLVAGDTIMQIGMEKSYEFNKTLVLNEHEVFDIEARGEPKEGTLHFIYRNDTGSDTILKTGRTGIVKDCWLTDLNKNTLPEIIVTLQSTDSKKLKTIAAYEIGKDRKPRPLTFNVQMPQEYKNKYNGFDSIYYSKDDNALYQQFLLTDSVNMGKIKYKLKGNTFEGYGFKIIEATGKVKQIL